MALLSAASFLIACFSPEIKVADFKLRTRSSLSAKWFSGGLLPGLLIVLPVCTILSLLSKQLVVRVKPSSWRLKAWSALIIVLVGDMLLEAWMRSISASCHFLNSEVPASPDYDGVTEFALHAFLRSWGYQCASPLVKYDDRFVGMLLFGMFRLFCMAAGTYIGQSFAPVALTGSIATGMLCHLIGPSQVLHLLTVFLL